MVVVSLPAEPPDKGVRDSPRVVNGMPRVRIYGVKVPDLHVPTLVGGLTNANGLVVAQRR